MSKYRVIKLTPVYSSFIVEADSLDEAIEKGYDDNYIEIIYDADEGDDIQIEVITQKQDADDITDFVSNDLEIVYTDWGC